jgi:DNA-binding MarR family transcriptional regulator
MHKFPPDCKRLNILYCFILTYTIIAIYNFYMTMSKNEITTFRQGLRRLEAEIGINLSGETSCCGVTMAQCHLLMEIDRYRGMAGTSLTELANNLRADKSALSRTLDSLVREGLASRAENQENRRKISVILTEKGEAKADYINGLCDTSYAGVLGLIPEDKRHMILESVTLLAEAMREARKKEDAPSCCERH